MSGKLITFEGIDGAGKTEAAFALAEHLRINGYDVVLTREPGGTEIGQAIREIVCSKTGNGLCSKAELFLFLADRAQHIQDVIGPALDAGKIVICDRYVDSTHAYQGGRGIDQILIMDMLAFIAAPDPDVTILLDVPVDIGLPRSKNKDRNNAKGLEYYEVVRKRFLDGATYYHYRTTVIDAAQDKAVVTAEVIKTITSAGIARR